MTNADLVSILRERVASHGGPALYAQRLGVSCAFVSQTVKGGKAISGRILRDLGYERVAAFRKASHEVVATSIEASCSPQPQE
jgi:hypothetical protein